MPHVHPRRAALVLAVLAASTAIALLAFLRSTSADAASSVNVTLSDFKIKAAPASTEHGRVTFRVRNAADMEHEMVVIKTNRKAGDLPMRSGKASEAGSKGEVELGAGKSKSLTLNLHAGHYVLICNVGQHYRAGMRTNFTVR